MSREEKLATVSKMAHRMRKKILQMALGTGGSTHIGGGLSIVDITATLYGAVMKVDSLRPDWSERDRFILSKGHGVLGYYTALSEVGFISDEDLLGFEQAGSDLLGHPIMNRKKGIEFSNGSLGMGLSLGIGVTLAGRRRNQTFGVYVLMGDGECNEGSVWEGAMAAAHFKLKGLTAIIDRNCLQQTGTNAEIMDVGNIADKWKAFGWDVVEVNGHNISELFDAFTEKSQAASGPLAVIAHTVKGEGFSLFENNNDWHHAPITQKQYAGLLEEFEALTK